MKGVVLRTLNAIDWDFAIPRSGYVAPPHWYPGTFIPALSDALVEALCPPGGTVFDPYGGIGTTGWSAIRTGRSCHIADINPIALLVTYTTTSLLVLARTDRSRALSALGALGRTIGRNEDLFGSAEPGTALELLDGLVGNRPEHLLKQLVVGPPVWEALREWLAKDTLTELGVVLEKISNSRSHYVRLIGLCMLSAIARSISSQHASWGHIADNVRPKAMTAQDIHAAIVRWLKRTKAFVNAPMLPVVDATLAVRSEVHLKDWSQPAEKAVPCANLLLTSPPYADAIDYTLAQRLSLYMLGYDKDHISRLVAGEIGARRKRFSNVSRARWSEQLSAALERQLNWVRPDGTVCLVLPHKDSGRSAGEDELKATLNGLGWQQFFEKDRSIHQSHTRQYWTSIKKETILAFRKAA